MSKATLNDLAINGGSKVRVKPWPARALFGQEEKMAVDQLFDQAIATGEPFRYDGPPERAYCEEFAQFMGGGYADAVNSGTTAVYVALRALELEPYSEVIVSPITDPGGCMPIPLLNCIPVVADAAPGCFNTGAEQIEVMVTPRTSAILVAHIMGEPADMAGIMAVAEKYNLSVVEDCAQAHGATINGKLVGSFGHLGAFSTMFGKHHATGSQGGIVYTQSEQLYKSVRHASDRGKPFGMPAGTSNVMASLNFNLGDLGAAIGRVQLKKLPHIVEQRRSIVRMITSGLHDVPAIVFPGQVDGAEPSYWYLRLELNTDVLTCTKQQFCAALAAEGVIVTPSYAHYPHQLDWFKNKRVFGNSQLPWSSPQYHGNPNQEFSIPNAQNAVAKQFLLTILESWTEQEATDIVTAITKVASAYSR